MNTHCIKAFRPKHRLANLGLKIVDPLNLASRQPQKVATIGIHARIALKAPVWQRFKACARKQFIALFVRVRVERVPYLPVTVVRTRFDKLWRQFARLRFGPALSNQNNGLSRWISNVYPLKKRDTLQVRRAKLLSVARPSFLHAHQLGHADALATHNLTTVGKSKRLATLNTLRPMWCGPSGVAIGNSNIGKASFVRPLNDRNAVVSIAG